MRWNRRESHMQCRAALTRIDALRTRELAPIEQTAVEQHLKTCRSCNESTDDVDSLAHAVKALAAVPARSCCEDVKKACVDSVDRVGDVWVAFSNRSEEHTSELQSRGL